MIVLILIGLGLVFLCATFISVFSDLEIYFPHCLFLAGFFLFAGFAVAFSEIERREKVRAKECVQSGGEWIRYSEQGFTCVEKKLE